MSFLQNPTAYIQYAETDVIKFFTVTVPAFDAKVVGAAEQLAQDFDNALQWIGAHGQTIAGDVAGLLGVLAAANLNIPVPVLAAATALSTAVKAVNDAIAAQQQALGQGGDAITQAVAAGGAAYQSVKAAQVAIAQAQAHVAATPAVPSTAS